MIRWDKPCWDKGYFIQTSIQPRGYTLSVVPNGGRSRIEMWFKLDDDIQLIGRGDDHLHADRGAHNADARRLREAADAHAIAASPSSSAEAC